MTPNTSTSTGPITDIDTDLDGTDPKPRSPDPRAPASSTNTTAATTQQQPASVARLMRQPSGPAALLRFRPDEIGTATTPVLPRRPLTARSRRGTDTDRAEPSPSTCE